MQVPPNETPEAVVSLFDTVTGLLSAYGWTILFFLVILNLLWSHFYPKYKKWKAKKDDETREEEYRRNPDLLLAREEALQKVRQKMQEAHDELAKQHDEKMKLVEERKRQEKIEKHERMQKGKSMITPEESSNLRRPDYNPLGGSGGSCSYRPSRRGMGGGGGGGGG